METTLQSPTSNEKKSLTSGKNTSRRGIDAQCPTFPSRQTVVQAKLELTTPGDSYEQEADRMADHVMRSAFSVSDGDGQSPRQTMSRPTVSRRSSGSGGVAVDSQTESGIMSSRGGGSSLPTALRSRMETGFGADFSNVRIHNDSTAASLSNSIQAKAFTYGNDIYFNRGQYSPETTEGQRLVAHELTHVAQGTGRVSRYGGRGYYESLSDNYNKSLDKKNPQTTNVTKKWKKGDPYITDISITLDEIAFSVSEREDEQLNIKQGITLYTKGFLSLKMNNDSFVFPNNRDFSRIPVAGGGDVDMTYGSLRMFTNGLRDIDTKVGQIKGWGFNSGRYTARSEKTVRQKHAGKFQDALYEFPDTMSPEEKEQARLIIETMSPEEREQARLDIYNNSEHEQIGNMDYAVFFNGGEAIHSGSTLDSSHGCIHIEDDVYTYDTKNIQFINQYSRGHVTRVHLHYGFNRKYIVAQMKLLGRLMNKIKKEDRESFLIKYKGFIESCHDVESIMLAIRMELQQKKLQMIQRRSPNLIKGEGLRI